MFASRLGCGSELLLACITGWLEAAAPYVAPERWRGVAADARSDQYALAVIAFRLLTGELPFAAEHAAQLAELHHIAVIPRPSTRRADLPPAADVAITRALAKVAGERFTTATGFIEALNGRPSRPQVVTNPVSVSGPDVPPAEARPWRRVSFRRETDRSSANASPGKVLVSTAARPPKLPPQTRQVHSA